MSRSHASTAQSGYLTAKTKENCRLKEDIRSEDDGSQSERRNLSAGPAQLISVPYAHLSF